MGKVFLFVLLVSGSVFAKNLQCDIKEFFNGNVTAQKLSVQAIDGDPHGRMAHFQGQVFSEVKGFVSLLENGNRTFAILSMHSDKLKANASAQHQMVVDGQYAELQFVVPGDSLKTSAVEILCFYFQ